MGDHSWLFFNQDITLAHQNFLEVVKMLCLFHKALNSGCLKNQYTNHKYEDLSK